MGTSDAKSSLSSEKRGALLTQLPAAFLDPLPAAYSEDSLFGPIVKSLSAGHTDEYPSFCLVDDVLFMEDAREWRLIVHKGRTIDPDLAE